MQALTDQLDPRGWLRSAIADGLWHNTFVAQQLDFGMTNAWTSFDAIGLNHVAKGNGLVLYGWKLYVESNWSKELFVTPDVWEKFVLLVQGGYQDKEFHNTSHAIEVTQATHYLMTQVEELRGVAEEPWMLFAACIAAMIHDLGHAGNSNTFHLNSLSEEALAHNDSSVQENVSLTRGFKMMMESGLYEQLSFATQRAVRERIIAMVLATDFSAHLNVVSAFKVILGQPNSKAPRVRSDGRPTDVFTAKAATMSAAEQKTVASAIIKIADVSFLSRGKEKAVAWTEKWVEEMCSQGEREEELGLPVTYDRATMNVADMQLSFLSLFARPLYEAVDIVAPMTQQLNELDTLAEYWTAEL